MVMEKTKNDSDTAPAEGAATAAAETAQRECYLSLGEADAFLNAWGVGLIRCRSKFSMRRACEWLRS